MSDESNAESLAAQAADAVRQLIADAEARADQIIREAEADAARIRDRADGEAGEVRKQAEADARAQINAARRALDELGGSLAAAVAATPGAESPPTPSPEPAPEPEPDESPGSPEAPVSPPASEEPPATEEASAGDGDDAAERLLAMKLAVDGKDPATIEAELIQKFGPGDRSALLKDVLSRIAR